jgi:CubicO group peptidase (beta-lactamase class C family)
MKKIIFYFTFILIILIGCNDKKSGLVSYLEINNKSQIDSITQTFIDREIYPFIYTRLEDSNGTVAYENLAKNERLLANENINGDTWIRIWSMSKIVTICLALDLMEDGIISLDDSVTKYISEFTNLKVAVSQDSTPIAAVNWYEEDSLREEPCPVKYVENDSVMTIVHLLNHQAGFYYSTTNINCIDSVIANENLAMAENSQDLINKMAKLPLVQNPGSYYYYGMNTTVLGLLCERATGKTLAQLVKERITDPMKIKGLAYDLPDGANMLPRFSGKDSILRIADEGELDIFGQNVPDYRPEHQLYLGGEGMIATANGYADFLRMLLNKGTLNGYRFLEESTIDDLTAPHTQKDNSYGHNGYNLWVSKEPYLEKGRGDKGLWIGGGYEGTHFWIDTKRGFVGTIMTQMFWVFDGEYGYTKDDRIRGAIYKPWTKIPYTKN